MVEPPEKPVKTQQMSNENQTEHNGMPHDQIDKASNIPPMPESFQAPGAPATRQGITPRRWAKVRFHGNYGLLCGQYQEFVRTNVDEDQIAQIGWAAFGKCGWNADRS